MTAPITQKVWTTLGPEFHKDCSDHESPICPKDNMNRFRSHLARCMESLGHESCKTDLDLWLKPEVRPEDGVQFYSYPLCYVDDILSVHHNADAVSQWLHKSFLFKPGFGNPDMYLSTKLCKTKLHNRVWEWAMSPVKSVQEAVRNCTVHLSDKFWYYI